MADENAKKLVDLIFPIPSFKIQPRTLHQEDPCLSLLPQEQSTANKGWCWIWPVSGLSTSTMVQLCLFNTYLHKYPSLWQGQPMLLWLPPDWTGQCCPWRCKLTCPEPYEGHGLSSMTHREDNTTTLVIIQSGR